LGDVTCFGIVMPLLASYAAEYRASTTSIGVLVASYSAMHFFLAPVWGRLSDRIGRRPVLLLGLVGTLLSSLLFAVAQSFLLLLLSRILAGGLGATLNVAQAYVADQSTPSGRTRVMGLVGAAFGFGFILGPTIGGLSTQLGNAAPGLAASAIAAANLLLALVTLREPAVHRPAFRAATTPLPWRPLIAPFAAAVASTLAFTVLYVVFPLHAEQSLGYDRSRVSYLFAFVGLMTAIVQGGLVGTLSRVLGEGRLLLLGGIMMATGLGLLPRVSAAGGTPFYAALAMVGIGFGFAGPAEAGYVSRTSAAELQGRILGSLQSINSIARILGPVAAGVAMGAGGAPTAFVGAAAFAAVAGILGLAMREDL
jgi:MFS family permease